MTGVEILASEQVVAESIFNWGIFFVPVLICFIVGIGLGVWCYHDTREPMAFVFFSIMGLVFGTGFGAIAGNECKIPSIYETEYKVVISDEVSMNDFYEHYEVISQEGKIYTVRERDTNGK